MSEHEHKHHGSTIAIILVSCFAIILVIGFAYPRSTNNNPLLLQANSTSEWNALTRYSSSTSIGVMTGPYTGAGFTVLSCTDEQIAAIFGITTPDLKCANGSYRIITGYEALYYSNSTGYGICFHQDGFWLAYFNANDQYQPWNNHPALFAEIARQAS